MTQWVNELPPHAEVPRRKLVEWLIRNFESLRRWSRTIQIEIEGLAGTVSYGAQITFNAGDGTPHGDLNATDFTGHPYADPDTPTALQIVSNGIVTFGHNAIAYLWTGPSGVTVGIGGSHTAVATDLTPIGTADHTILVNRGNAEQHPTSAITNLDNEQAIQDANISQNASNLANHIGDTNNPHVVNHSQLPDVNPDPSDPHPVYSKKLPAMILAESADSFTLNTTDSKLVNYTLFGEIGGSGMINPIAGEITIPSQGVYRIYANVLGLQGNDTKEEWIELRLDVAVVNPERYVIGFVDVTTDKTNTRQVASFGAREFVGGEVVSLWMWASAGLGTFTIVGITFEVEKKMETGQYVRLV